MIHHNLISLPAGLNLSHISAHYQTYDANQLLLAYASKRGKYCKEAHLACPAFDQFWQPGKYGPSPTTK